MGSAGVIDWELAVREIVANVRAGVAAGEIAARFHNTLVEAIIEAARFAGETCVVLSGGCFQNKYLTERAVCRLREGLSPVLAPARAAERWRDRAWANRCRVEGCVWLGHGRAAKKRTAGLAGEPRPRTLL